MNLPVPAITDDYRATAAACLDRLGWAVADTELVAVTRYAEAVPMLRVFHPKLPNVGESISAVPVREDGADPVWWYRHSGGGRLAPCADPSRALECVFELLDLVIRIAHGERVKS
ncbi:hypothetical protein [Actinomadura sp. 21ATH]|uniref:hypothetical protein n=1 Tax=Actinomadura sp. 21ATH TaxID=1735444 RepID=UPI0035C07494